MGLSQIFYRRRFERFLLLYCQLKALSTLRSTFHEKFKLPFLWSKFAYKVVIFWKEYFWRASVILSYNTMLARWSLCYEVSFLTANAYSILCLSFRCYEIQNITNVKKKKTRFSRVAWRFILHFVFNIINNSVFTNIGLFKNEKNILIWKSAEHKNKW